MAWSYRDLVFLRLLARMRHHGVDRDLASAHVAKLRELLAQPDFQHTKVHIAGGLIIDGEETDLLTGQQAFAEALAVLDPFDLTERVDGVNDRPTHGPDLIEPSTWTYISPSVMGGEPCVSRSRIPSATVASLVHERDLTAAKIISLYPQLTEEAIEDAVAFEADLMHRAAVAA
ncbi:DUF433 domain-containing protein [Euzebya sp.]|uniref:DUF433 domain-containing protein n=1 Tax=Euzebya sp. TaxID=1971409 RepID=UPI0035186D21